MAEILYGIRKSDQKSVSIGEITVSGSACECDCPLCGRPLQACSLNGKVGRYFRHHTSVQEDERRVNCDPLTANETALHRMAKQIIEEKKKILIPSKNITCVEAGIRDLPQSVKDKLQQYEYQKETVIEGRSVEIEKRLDGFIPDVSLQAERRELFIEIFVRHKVSGEKLAKVKAYGVAMLELDLSPYLESPVDSDRISEIILDEIAQKKWLFYPFPKKIVEKAKLFYEGQEAVISYRKQEAERREAEISAQKDAQKKKLARERAQKRIDELFRKDNYANAIRDLRDDESFMWYCNETWKPIWYDFGECFRLSESVPFFVDIPITGEMVFRCDRRIWQSLVFNRYIYGRKENGAAFNAINVFGDLRKDYAIPIDYDLIYKLKSPLARRANIWLPRDVIIKYLDYLNMLGFITEENYRHNGDLWMTVLKKKTIAPPDSMTARALKEAIDSVDCYAPNIDMLIYEKFLI